MSTSVSGISSSAVALPSVASGQAAKTTSAANGSAASGASKTAASSQAQQQAALNRLLAKYKASLARGQTPNDLASLARQINSAAKALGQHVTLPKAPAGQANAGNGQATAQSLSQQQSPATGGKGVNLTA